MVGGVVDRLWMGCRRRIHVVRFWELYGCLGTSEREGRVLFLVFHGEYPFEVEDCWVAEGRRQCSTLFVVCVG